MKPGASLKDDKDALKASADLQQKSKDVLSRMEQELAETEQVGAMTLEDLYEQRRRLEGIDAEGDRLHDKLDETEKLHAKLGTWFGGFGGGKSNRRKLDVPAGEKENNQHDTMGDNNEKKKKNNKWKFSKYKKKTSDEPVLPGHKGLLNGEVANANGEHQEELNALAQGDEELDAHMDVIGNQLDNLLTMTQEMGTEAKGHGRQLEKVDQQVAEATQRQDKANKKTRRLLYGRKNDK